MNLTKNRILIRWLLIALGTIIILVTGSYFVVSHYAEKEIFKRISSANGKVSAVNINMFTQTLHLTNLQWQMLADSVNPYPSQIRITNVSIEGIDLTDLFFEKIINIEHVTFDSGLIDYNTFTKKPVSGDSSKNPYSTLSVHNISLRNINTQLREDTATYFKGTVNATITDLRLQLDSLKKPTPHVTAVDAIVTNIQLHHPEGMYHGTINQIHLQSKTGVITVDSLLLIPSFGKYAFARVEGKQVGRINLSVPSLTMEGLEWNSLLPDSFVISKIRIPSFDVFAFRDRRIPFTRTDPMPMPMVSFSALPFAISIDSVIIDDAHIVIQEIAETSTSSGTVTFDHVTATIVGLTNRRSDSEYATLKATGLFMNAGAIDAEFMFPLNGSPIYKARGTISKMNLDVINPMLENMVDLRVKTGRLNSLTFDFNYTDFTSKGSLNLAYEDLRITSLNKNKSSTNEMKTLLIKVFMKREQLKATPLSKRMGVIDIKRDRTRFIFNFWWKSIHDGLKSSMAGNKKQNR